MPKINITQFKTSDGRTIDVPLDGVVLFVGPNNSGKSQALRDLKAKIEAPAQNDGVTVKQLSVARSTDGQDWADRAPLRSFEGRHIHDIPGWGQVTTADVDAQWQSLSYSGGTGILSSLFVILADGSSRLNGASSQPSIDFSVQTPQHPVQRMYVDVRLDEEMNSLCKQAFGLPLVVDRFSGSMIHIRVGDRPALQSANGVPTQEYMDQLHRVPRLDEQGDGVKAYIGLLLLVQAGRHDIILIDEPEAFLHPPQARLLGKVLADKSKAKQAFIATHSTDFLQGVLQSDRPTTIVRLSRAGSINHASILDQTALKSLWSDSLLRQSNVLDGLFHDAVVICESDSDCQYYSAVRQASAADDSGEDRSPDVLFTYSSTKSRMWVVAQALQAVNVPTVVVADVDLLRDANDVRRLMEVLGGRVEDVEADRKLVADALNAPNPLKKRELIKKFTAAIDAIDTDIIDKVAATQLRNLIKTTSGWDEVKKAGSAMIPRGEAQQAYLRVTAHLEKVGILLVPVGELEGFVRSVGGHGPRWVAEVFEKGLDKEPSREASEFVAKMYSTAQLRAARGMTSKTN